MSDWTEFLERRELNASGTFGRCKIMPSGCWEMSAEADHYATVTIGGVNIAAHRAMFILLNGPLGEGDVVCHSCDNKRCVCPMHLNLGTRQLNSIDMVFKGRGRQKRGITGPAVKRSVAPDSLNYNRVSISLRRAVFVAGRSLAKAQNRSFSSYVAWLIANDSAATL